MKPYLMLAKPGITVLITLTAAVGYIAAAGSVIDTRYFIEVLLSTALLSSGAAATNQILERRFDARMSRTRKRPLVTGAITVNKAAAFAALMATSGGLIALFALPPSSAVLLYCCYVSYIAYTLLKRHVWWCTLVGGIPGALPVLAGWFATGAPIAPTAVALVGVMYLWQMPHFLSIGWLCREDYRRAGFHVISVGDNGGVVSGRVCMAYALAVIPVSFVPFVSGAAGLGYLVAAALSGGAYLWFAERFASRHSPGSARQLFFTTLAYLPTVFLALLVFRAT